jgi:Arc/MetJ family transcription regulator
MPSVAIHACLTQETVRINELLREQETVNLRKLLRQEVDRLATQLQEQDKAPWQQQLQQADQRLTTQLQELDQKHTQNAKTVGDRAHAGSCVRNYMNSSQRLNNMKVINRIGLFSDQICSKPKPMI